MKKTFLTAVAVLFALSATAGAAGLAITNAGFEDPPMTEGNYNYEIPGWDYIPTGLGGAGVWNPDATGAIFYGYGGLAPEGLNVAWIESGWIDNTPDNPDDDDWTNVEGGIAQVLADTLTANTAYTLTVEIGNSYYYDWGEGYKVQLLAGGNLLAEDDSSLTPAIDTFETSTVTYTSGASVTPGQALEIRLLAKIGNGELDVDNVVLTPEPTTMGLLGLGALALIRRKRK